MSLNGESNLSVLYVAADSNIAWKICEIHDSQMSHPSVCFSLPRPFVNAFFGSTHSSFLACRKTTVQGILLRTD